MYVYMLMITTKYQIVVAVAYDKIMCVKDGMIGKDDLYWQLTQPDDDRFVSIYWHFQSPLNAFLPI